MKEKLNVKKIITIVFVVFAVISVLQTCSKDDNEEKKQEVETYTLVGETIGQYGKEVILNADTDMPSTKYLYKLPAGSYTVTTTFDKLAAFWIVKDEPVNTGTDAYPEELSYVGGQYSLTNGKDDFNGMAKKQVEVTIGEDESILIIGTVTFTFTKK